MCDIWDMYVYHLGYLRRGYMCVCVSGVCGVCGIWLVCVVFIICVWYEVCVCGVWYFVPVVCRLHNALININCRYQVHVTEETD